MRMKLRESEKIRDGVEREMVIGGRVVLGGKF